MSRPLIEIENLHVKLGGVPILRGLNTVIDRNQITALIGLNGSGKTTLLRAILKEVPFTGTFRFHCGHDHSQPFPTHIGYVPQRLLFDPNLPLTVCELMALAISRRPLFLGIGKSTRERVINMLKRVWADSWIDHPVGGLSGGQLQRVLLSLALEPKPELLLLDEPAQGIDFQQGEKFYQLIERISREQQITVLLVSHDLSIVTKYAHQVLCLNEGKIQCSGQPSTILAGEMISQIFGPHMGSYDHHHDHSHEGVELPKTN